MKHFPTLLEYSLSEKSRIQELADKRGDEFISHERLDAMIRRSFWAAITFYSRPLALWMFVPCGEDGKPLSEPVVYHQYICGQLNESEHPTWIKWCRAYQAAQSRVLFEGWEYVQDYTEGYHALFRNDWQVTFIPNGEVRLSNARVSIHPESVEEALFAAKKTSVFTPAQSAMEQLKLKE